MSYRQPIEIDEWYHCFNRGVDKRKVFMGPNDYLRFETLLYVCNSTKPTHISNIRVESISQISANTVFNRGKPIVEIGAYSLMPNHIHLVLKEIQERGIATFMQKVFTAYTMYFNKRNERTGSLFAGPFKSKHIYDDLYFKQCVAYVHMNPVEIFEAHWKDGVGNISEIKRFLKKYPYSSLGDFLDPDNSRRKILGQAVFDAYDSIPTVTSMLTEAQSYYVEHNIKARP